MSDLENGTELLQEVQERHEKSSKSKRHKEKKEKNKHKHKEEKRHRDRSRPETTDAPVTIEHIPEPVLQAEQPAIQVIHVACSWTHPLCS